MSRHQHAVPGPTGRAGRAAVAQFALSGLAIVALLGFAGVELLRNAGGSEALRHAKDSARLAARGIAQPALTPGVLRGEGGSLRRFDRVMRASVVRPPIVRVKIWGADGRIVYSDEPRLIGTRYPLGPDELAVLRSGGVEADISDLSRPENRFERGQGKLLEVYLPIDAAGRRLLFELYQRESAVSASSRHLWLAFAPALVGGLLLLQLLQLPLARSLVRRIRRAGDEREALLRRAVDASDQERRRLAAVLHDGVVQDLAGVSYRLAAAPDPAVRDAAGSVRGAVQELRSLLVDLYPGGLHGVDLPEALGEVAAQLERAGVAATVEVDVGEGLPDATEELVYRTVREGARNVVRHAQARHAAIRVRRNGTRALLEVQDDGRGPAPDGAGPGEGHFGLALLRDLIAEQGGELRLDPAPGGGAILWAVVPLP